MTSMASLMEEAKRLGVRVHLAHLDDPFLGLYDDAESRIYLRLGMPMAEVKETLAHELAHAYYRHPCSSGPHERNADRRGAWLLVDPDAYAAAERISSDVWFIAEELGLTPSVVENYQRYWLDSRAI